MSDVGTTILMYVLSTVQPDAIVSSVVVVSLGSFIHGSIVCARKPLSVHDVVIVVLPAVLIVLGSVVEAGRWPVMVELISSSLWVRRLMVPRRRGPLVFVGVAVCRRIRL